MNKTEIIDAIAAKTGETKTAIGRTLDALAEVSREELEKGGEVRIAGFVKLAPQQKAARTGRNPQTGAAVEIPARTVIKAKVFDTLMGSK